MCNRVDVTSEFLAKKIGHDPIQLNIYGAVNKKSIVNEIKKLYPHLSDDIDNVFTVAPQINKQNCGIQTGIYSYRVFCSK